MIGPFKMGLLFRVWRMWDESLSWGSRITEGWKRAQEAARMIQEFISDPEKKAELEEFLSGLTENERKVWELRFAGSIFRETVRLA